MTRNILLTRWTEIGDKIVKLAEEFPAEKYDSRPEAGVRTFADHLRHLAFWNQYVRKSLRGESPDGAANELPAEKYSGKAKLVAVLDQSFSEVKAELGKGKAALEESALDTVIAFIEHSGEHYGALAVYYRLNGLVPPASRG